jgi:hypothetical protein
LSKATEDNLDALDNAYTARSEKQPGERWATNSSNTSKQLQMTSR